MKMKSSSSSTAPRRSFLAGAFAGAAGATAGLSSLPRAAGAAASLSSAYDPAGAATRPLAGRNYFPPLTPPLANRATYRYELGRNAWALEQLLVFSNVSATVRTIVIKLEDGSLWVDGPQWPTGEFCALLDELGPVGHVVLPCVALEHKAPMQAFTKKYPSASVWVAPGQYGPFGEIGLDAASSKMPYRVDGVFPVGAPKEGVDALPPWANEFDMRTLYVSLPENAGPVSETAFYHKPSKTLVTTDAVVWVPDEAPPIFGTFFDEEATAADGFWAKSVLQAVFLPLRFVEGKFDPSNYDAVRGRLLRAPILRAFADARAPQAVKDWVTSVANIGPFDRILTAHFASPISVTDAAKDFSSAFTYLDGPSSDPPIRCGDWELLDGLNDLIATNKLGAPIQEGFDFKAGCKP